MSPKSLLRHKRAVSEVRDLSRYGFQTIIDEINEEIDREAVSRVILCSGKVYYDLLEMRELREIDEVAIIRIEQLHPFPVHELTQILRSYPDAKEIVWCQEEPQNQGAWYRIWHRLRECRRKGQKIICSSRPEAPSPAVGHYRMLLAQQEHLISEALSIVRNVVPISQPRRARSNVN